MNEQAHEVVLNPTPSNAKTKFLRLLRGGTGKANWRRGHEGQALVEFALAIPFLLILLLVLVEVGFLLRTHTSVTASVREGARIASAAGAIDPLKIEASSGRAIPTGVDANTVTVGAVNISLGTDISKVITGGMELYRPKNWTGAGDDYASTGFLSSTDSSQAWATVINPDRAAANTVYRHVFGKIAVTGLFSTSTAFDLGQTYVDGSVCTLATCGSFRFNPVSPTATFAQQVTANPNIPLPTEINTARQAKFKLNPWYPTFRRSCDVPQNNPVVTEDVRSLPPIAQNYYTSPSAPDWVGFRITYVYQLQFVPNVFLSLLGANWNSQPGLILGDRAIRLMEPASSAVLQDCKKSRAQYLDYSPNR